MLRIFTLTMLALAVTACGDFTVEQPETKDEEQERDEADREGGHVGETSEEAGPAEEATEPKADSIKEDTAAAGPDAIFAPKEQGWAAVVAAAPKGYRLPSRGEIVELRDQGVLAELGVTTQQLWSSTEESATIAYFVDGDTALEARMGKTMPMAAVYVRGEQ